MKALEEEADWERTKANRAPQEITALKEEINDSNSEEVALQKLTSDQERQRVRDMVVAGELVFKDGYFLTPEEAEFQKLSPQEKEERAKAQKAENDVKSDQARERKKEKYENSWWESDNPKVIVLGFFGAKDGGASFITKERLVGALQEVLKRPVSEEEFEDQKAYLALVNEVEKTVQSDSATKELLITKEERDNAQQTKDAEMKYAQARKKIYKEDKEREEKKERAERDAESKKEEQGGGKKSWLKRFFGG